MFRPVSWQEKCGNEVIAEDDFSETMKEEKEQLADRLIHDFYEFYKWYMIICLSNKEDMKKRGWEQCDFVYVSGDAYVDHPSFGTAIISRLLEAHGYKVGIIAQLTGKIIKASQILGRRHRFLVSAGNMDSMVNHYSVSKKRRKEDSYTPGGVMGKRPDYAVVVTAI